MRHNKEDIIECSQDFLEKVISTSNINQIDFKKLYAENLNIESDHFGSRLVKTDNNSNLQYVLLVAFIKGYSVDKKLYFIDEYVALDAKELEGFLMQAIEHAKSPKEIKDHRFIENEMSLDTWIATIETHLHYLREEVLK